MIVARRSSSSTDTEENSLAKTLLCLIVPAFCGLLQAFEASSYIVCRDRCSLFCCVFYYIRLIVVFGSVLCILICF